MQLSEHVYVRATCSRVLSNRSVKKPILTKNAVGKVLR